jgi:hypothetical protein
MFQMESAVNGQRYLLRLVGKFGSMTVVVGDRGGGVGELVEPELAFSPVGGT